MVGSITIGSRGDFAHLAVVRHGDVPEVFWSRVLSEWGTEGPDPLAHIHVPIERFLSQLDWLAGACRRQRVSIEWTEETHALVAATLNERRVLEEKLQRNGALRPDEVSARLAQTRFSRQLFEFQLRDLGKLLALPNGANFSVPGAGKTTVTYALYEAERAAGRVERMLVVGPLSSFDAWMSEARDCFSSEIEVHRCSGVPIPQAAEVCLTTYQRLSSDYTSIAKWVAEQPTHVVLDEAHRMKRGWSGEWGRSSLTLAYLAKRRDVLTGTPAPQSMRDLEALLDFIWPGQARRILPAGVFDRNPPPDVASDVAPAVRPLTVRTTKSDLSLPLPNLDVLVLPLDGLQREIYFALRNEYAGRFALSRRDRIDFAKMGEVVMYLLEAATNPQLLVAGSSRFDDLNLRHPPLEIPEGSSLNDLLATYGRYETPKKFIELAKLIMRNAEAGRKTLVWTNFVRNIQTLERILSRYEPAVIHGGVPSEVSQPTSTKTREAELQRFRSSEDCKVLLANPAAASEGVSLHRHCHDAVYIDRTFNAGQYLQSVDRIHRLGMDKHVETNITFIITEATIDEVVDRRIREKVLRLGAMLEDGDIATMALPDEEDYGRAIETDEDLASLFAHLRGDQSV